MSTSWRYISSPRLSLISGEAEALAGLVVVPGDSHALPAASGGGLDHHRVADVFRDRDALLSVLRRRREGVNLFVGF